MNRFNFLTIQARELRVEAQTPIYSALDIYKTRPVLYKKESMLFEVSQN